MPKKIMTSIKNRAFSLVMSAVMAMSLLTLPAGAAGTSWVTATLDGKGVYNESYPEGAVVNEAKLVGDLGVGVDVKVSVNGTASTTARPINMSGTLTNGTVYRLFENSDRSLSLTTTNKQIKDNINVDITRTARAYTVTANSGAKGFKDDLGSDSNPTCAVSSGSTTVSGNTAWSGTFTPNDGLIIKALNIRTTGNSRNIVDVDAGSVTVGSTKLTITRSGNSVKVSADQVADNLFITALTVERSAQHQLSVVTVGDVTSSVVSELLEAGTSKNIVLTPGSTSIVDSIEINDGGKVGTLNTSTTSVSVNGHTYKVTRDLSGKATLSVPAIAADVKVTATAVSNKAGLVIKTPSDVKCNLSEQSFPEKGSAVEVRLTPDDDSEITSIKIQSATDSVTLNSNEYRFILDGRVYRVDTRYDSSRILYFDSFPGNVQISVESREFRHTIKLDTDKGCDYEGSSDKLVVDEGGSRTFSFVSLRDYTIERLIFNVDGSTIEARRNDSYVNINGTRCPITWEDGRVTVTVYDVEDSMTVKARTDAYDEDYRIMVDCDGGVTTPASRVYANRGNSKTITFTNRNGYRAQRIDVVVKGETYSAYRNDSYITIDGRRCSLTWSSSKASITLSNIRSDMEVYCDSDYDGTNESRPIEGDYVVTLLTDYGASYSGSGRIGVKSGDSKTVSFEAEDDCRLQRLVVTYKDETYRIARGESNVYIDGYRCSVDWKGSTSVSLTLRDIRGDVTVEAQTDYDGPTGSYYIDRRAGAGTQITLDSSSNSVRPNKSVTVTVAPEYGYEVDSVEFKLGNAKAVTVSGSTKTLRLNGRSYNLSWSNGTLMVTFDKLTNDLVVTSTARQTSNTPTTPSDQPNQPTGSVYHTAYIAGVGGGLFQPDRAITRAEALTMLVQAYRNGAPIDMTGSVAVPFADVQSGSWYYNFVAYAYNQGYLAGLHNVTPASFRPGEVITRAEFVEMAERFIGVAPTGYTGTKYGDVLTGHWASGAIAFATNQGWISGYPNGNFGPEDSLTRAQLVTIVNNMLGRVPNRASIDANFGSLKTFSDVGPAHWAYYHILEAANAHYCNVNAGVETWTR